MSECCGPSQPCCGSVPDAEYDYGPEPYVVGSVETFAGPVRRATTALSAADRRGAVRVRLGVGRDEYRVRPGLYALGEPDDTAPVLVTANYKLSFDAVRAQLTGRDAWLLVLDTKGINVWCAAGKGTFGTRELVARVREAHLEQIVSHAKLIVPQLGATGVAAHEVRAATGFSVIWGPVRADDLTAFLDAGLKATPPMRRVGFPMRERAKLVGVELSVLWRRSTLLGAAAVAALIGLAAGVAPALTPPLTALVVIAVAAVVAGAAVAPLLLPWLPGRAFSLKGAIAGALTLGSLGAVMVGGVLSPLYVAGIVVAGVALASFVAMNFTGSSTYTSPSGVEWEMRRAIPAQAVAALVGVVAAVVALVAG